jgi:hypothetical protein
MTLILPQRRRLIRPVAGGTITPSFLGSDTSAANLTTYTFSSKTLGTGLIVVGVTGVASSGGRTSTAMTIGGVSATKAIEAVHDTGGISHISAIWYADVDTASGDIVVTFSVGIVRANIGWWLLEGAAATPTDTASDTIGSPVSGDIDIAAGGVAIGYASATTGISSGTLSGVAEDFDEVGEDTYHLGGHSFYASAQTAQTIEATWSGTPTFSSFVCASWEPA